jgi:hypothetical protein
MTTITVLAIPAPASLPARLIEIPADPTTSTLTGIHDLGAERHQLADDIELWCHGEGTINPRAHSAAGLILRAVADSAWLGRDGVTPERAAEVLETWGSVLIFGRAALVGRDRNGDPASTPTIVIDFMREWGVLGDAAGAVPVRGSYAEHGEPSTGTYYGNERQPHPTGCSVTLARRGTGVEITGADGQRLAYLGNTGKFWLARAAS